MKYLLLIHFSLLSLIGLSQHSFEFTYQTDDDEEIFEGMQDLSGNFVLCGRIGNYMREYNPLVIKVNPDGEYISRKFNLTDSIGSFHVVTQTPDSNYLFIGKYSITTYDEYNYLWVVKTDTNLNTIFERSYCIANNLYNHCNIHRILVENDSIFCLSGSKMYIGDTYPEGDLWMLKCSFYGDTLLTKSHRYNNHQWAQDLTEIPSSKEYMVIGGSFDGSTSDVELFRMDSMFNYKGFTNVPKNAPNKYIQGRQASSDIWLNDTVFIMSTTAFDTVNDRADDSSIGIFKVDTAGNIHDQLIVGKPDTAEYAAHYNSMATVNDSTIYIGGYSIIISFWPEDPNILELYLVDTSLNLRGYIQYGNDAYYWLNGVIPSNDGGCLIYSCRYDYQENNQERDVHIIKVQRNDMDIITSISYVSVDKSLVLPYPVPVNDILNIPLLPSIDNQMSTIAIYTIDGRKVFDKTFDRTGNLMTLNLSPLKNGIYIYSIYNANKITQTGKFIKNSN